VNTIYLLFQLNNQFDFSRCVITVALVFEEQEVANMAAATAPLYDTVRDINTPVYDTVTDIKISDIRYCYCT